MSRLVRWVIKKKHVHGVTVAVTDLLCLFKGLWDCFPLGVHTRRLTRYCVIFLHFSLHMA